ncbi:YegP family protein [Micromonospora halotolerans]|uniref:YegP family protein n=1 Tax=Micromonospora halotolerans TaxID=709879 RepID=A0ABY9ZT93_9ACTN|nr:YegP family protein [Micromonospora halotolerans]WNM38448.1 YegP family protein [Micromonospora halotolerans]
MKFLIAAADTGTYGFTLLGDDGQVVATGRQYPDKAAALAVVADMMREIGDAEIEERTEPAERVATPPSRTVDGEPDLARIGRSGIPPV